MKRRFRAGGEASKARRRKTPEPKRRNAPKAVPRSNSPPTQEETEVARLTRELNEALEQQAATSEVLGVINSASGELERVFQSMLQNATRICDATFGNIYRWDGQTLQLVGTHNTPPAFAEARKRHPFRPDPNVPASRAMTTRSVIHITDAAAERSYIEERRPPFVDAVELGGVRTVLLVPMLKETGAIGVFALYRQEVRPFTDKQIELVKNFAAQAVIAIENARLLNELRQRTTDLTEALEQQTAASDVLQVLSGSAGDLELLFGTMLEKAVRYCDAKFGTLFLREEDQLSLVAAHNMPTAFSEAHRCSPGIVPGGPVEAAMRTRRTVHMADLAATQSYLERHPRAVDAVELGGVRTVVAVPMLKDDEPIGAIVIHRPEVRPFTDKQIALLTNFAAQAVIAIENARLLNELRQRTTDLTERTADLTEALEQQTATSEVLQVISSSPGDLEPVFQAMLENATRICEAKFGVVFSFDGNEFHFEAQVGTPPELAEILHRARPMPQPLPGSLLDRVRQTKRVSYTADYAAEGIPAPPVTLGGARSTVDVPMLKDNELVGAFSIYRQEVRPFTEKQIALMQNFAAQAVIAIENARLLNELRQRTTDLTERTGDLTEALEQQTATSDVLRVVSSSAGDLQPVFATMLEKATRLCEANFGILQIHESGEHRIAAMYNVPVAFVEHRQRVPVLLPTPKSAIGRAAATKQLVHITDYAEDMAYKLRDPSAVNLVELAGARSLVVIPMLKDETLIGTFSIYGQEVRPFTDKQIALVQNFAAQAVIAIENARLLNELRQSLEQQTATANVLDVISRSAFDLRAVFETVAESSVTLCGADRAFIFQFDGTLLRMAASYNATPEFAEWVRQNPIHPGRHSGSARAALERKTVHIPDVRADPEYVYGAKDVEAIRTVLGVPILKGDELLGVMMIYHLEVRPFTDNQIALVETFADQAAIAIENVRLFEAEQQRARENARLLSELRERTTEVEKLNQQLEARVADQVGEIERMGRLRRFLPPQVADLIVASGTEKQLESHRREITALFCDLRGFTGFTETADAEDVMALLRDYHATVGEKIIKYSGTLERYAGDGVMVVFNDPVPVDNPAIQAVLMALEMRDAIGALTETWRRVGHDIGFGIGIAHGFATLGTIGFEGRFDYAAIGTVSNVASRLCDEAKPGQILISPRVLMAVEKAVTVEPVGEFALKGIRRPLAAYNVVAASPSKV